MQNGFWGPPTSTVDWCEANYEHSRYIAEFFNTTSSFAMVLVGLIGIALHARVLERRFLFAFGLVSLVGLGSIAFHGTLRFELQMMDELPMVYLVTLIVWILLENRPTPRFGAWFPAVLVGYCVLVTLLATFSRGQVEFFVFQIGFGSLELFSLFRIWRVQRRLEVPRARLLFRLGIASYLFAIVIWFIDLRACSFVSQTLPFNPQFHAWWHVLVSIGFYLLLLVIAVDRMRTIGKEPVVKFAPVPCVQAGN